MSRPHAAALVEDAWHRQVDRVLRRRRWRNRVIPHIGYGTQAQVRVFARVVLSPGRDETDPGDEQRADADPTYGGLRSPFGDSRGWRNFVAAPAMAVPVTIEIGGAVAHTRSDRSGHVDHAMAVDGLSPGWQDATITAAHAEPVTAKVLVVGAEQTFGIISDIDDTVISTSLPRLFIAAWNTFVLSENARHVVPGMAPLYRDLLAEHPGAPIIYVSTGAWNTAPTLTRFLRSQGYPLGPLLLTDWGPTNTGWFRSGRDHKRHCLNRLARDFPNISWVLVGDDGQHDPELYGDFAEARPDRVRYVAIRQLTPGEQVLSHGLPVPTDEITGRNQSRPLQSDSPVFQAPDGYGLLRLLRAAGLLGRRPGGTG